MCIEETSLEWNENCKEEGSNLDLNTQSIIYIAKICSWLRNDHLINDFRAFE